MKLLKLCWLPVLLMAMFLFGCASSSPEHEKNNSGKRVEKQKPVADGVLQAGMLDSISAYISLRSAAALNELPDSLEKYSLDSLLEVGFRLYRFSLTQWNSSVAATIKECRNRFFARWKQTSDSICGTIPVGDSMANEISLIYKAVLEYDIQSDYEYLLKKMDSTHYDEKKDVSLDEKIFFLKKGKLPRYFVQNVEYSYRVVSASSMEDLQNPRNRNNNWIKIDVECLNRGPLDQEVLVHRAEYEALLDSFVRIEDERFQLKLDYLGTEIHSYGGLSPAGHFVRYVSSPVMSNLTFNEERNLVEAFVSSTSYDAIFYLSKNDGQWKVVEVHDLVM